VLLQPDTILKPVATPYIFSSSKRAYLLSILIEVYLHYSASGRRRQ